MEIPRRLQLNQWLLGVLLLTHPGPVLLHIVGVTIFALLAAWPHFDWSVLVFVIGAHAAMKFSISMINDYCDRAQDAKSKPSKPIPRGLVPALTALALGLLMIALMVLLLIPLPPLAWALSLAYLALGQAYNLGLKSTPFSGIVFALAMPLIPLYAFAALGHLPSVLFWLVPLGFLLGVAINLVDSLPDLEGDAKHGARTLAVALGTRHSFLTSRLLIVASAALIVLLWLTGLVHVQPWILGATLALACVGFALMLLFFGPDKPAGTRRGYFYVVVCTCLALVGGWLIGVFA
jgi:4-hydroxybenzoate polyprenyltransferase